MDREISAAAKAGIKFWAFDWYGLGSSLRKGWELYQSSSLRDSISWCGIVPLGSIGSAPYHNGSWRGSVWQWSELMSSPNYQKVSSNGSSKRPLLFLLWDDNQLTTYFASLSNLGKALSVLAEQVVTAGLDVPYIVLLHRLAGAPIVSAIGAQAISSYVPRIRQEHCGTYKSLDRQVREYWSALRATGVPIIPIAMVGWDTRPRQESAGPFKPARGPSPCYALATPTQFAEHVRAAVRYIEDHPTACPSRVLLIYSWNECDEGGGLTPTLGDPTGSYLTAIAPLLK
jgi:Glycosyltransferase WbsX